MKAIFVLLFLFLTVSCIRLHHRGDYDNRGGGGFNHGDGDHHDGDHHDGDGDHHHGALTSPSGIVHADFQQADFQQAAIPQITLIDYQEHREDAGWRARHKWFHEGHWYRDRDEWRYWRHHDHHYYDDNEGRDGRDRDHNGNPRFIIRVP